MLKSLTMYRKWWHFFCSLCLLLAERYLFCLTVAAKTDFTEREKNKVKIAKEMTLMLIPLPLFGDADGMCFDVLWKIMLRATWKKRKPSLLVKMSISRCNCAALGDLILIKFPSETQHNADCNMIPINSILLIFIKHSTALDSINDSWENDSKLMPFAYHVAWCVFLISHANYVAK